MINEILASLEGSHLVVWYTTLIIDGDYILRLMRRGLDGAVNEAQIVVQVGNYTSTSSMTASPFPATRPVLQHDTPGVLQAPATRVPLISTQSTARSRNRASQEDAIVLQAFMRGGLAAVAVLFLTGAVIVARRR